MGRDKKKREVADAEVSTEHAPVSNKNSKRRVRIADDLPESSAGASSSAPSESRKAAIAEEECETHGGRKRKRLRKNKHKHQLENFKKAKLNVVEPEVGTKTFSDFDVDERILKAIGNLGWKWPTQVQESMFTLALEDKNIMARARTGSGKTGAYLIPIIHKCIAYSSDPGEPRGPSALFIAPTKELCVQVDLFIINDLIFAAIPPQLQINELLMKLLHPLPFLRALNLSDLNSDERSVWEHDFANFVVSTPGKILEMLSARPEFCSDVRHLVLDEADLLLSFGYEEEMNTLKKHLPPSYQCILTSATITDDMSALKSLFMTGSVFTIKLKEGDLPDVDQLTQYQITCLDDNERFAILVSMFKLRLIVGKTIIFVNDTNRCYLTSLVLRAFGLKSCILNSSMPANSRFHVINQYNNGACDIVIASDAVDAFGSDTVQPKEPARRDKEAGVSRGIDFHQVGNVVNLDFPTSTDNYIHRVG
ncbi:DEAD/DEAH box helicase, partial [Ancylostoma duodenale]